MLEASCTIKFWPLYSQFVLYDVKTPFDPDMEAHFNAPGEFGDGALRISIRRLEVSIALFEDADVTIELTTHPHAPEVSAGAWDRVETAPLSLPSGYLGIRSVIADNDRPSLSLDVGAGQLMVRSHGRLADSHQSFAVQIWRP
jgi:hypothetical protein